MPFAGYTDFDACVADHVSQGKSAERARRICGAIKAKAEAEEIIAADMVSVQVLDRAGNPIGDLIRRNKESSVNSWILEAILQRTAEAKNGLSLDERLSRVSDALRQRFLPKDNGRMGYVWPVATYDDYVIFRKESIGVGKPGFWRIDYTWTIDGTVELKGEPIEVVQKYAPVREGAFLESIITTAAGNLIRIQAEVLGPVAEAAGSAPTGKLWDVLLIQEGMSKNRNRYNRKVLAEAAPLYDKARMFLDHKLETGPFGRSGAEAMGFAKNIRPVVLSSTTEADGGASLLALAGTAVVTKKHFREELLDAYQEGHPDFFGLSHDVRAESQVVQLADGAAYDVNAIRKVESVDWVLNPSAGGRVLRLVASEAANPQLQEDVRMLQHLIESLKKAGVTVPEGCDEATATRLLTEALAARPVVPVVAVVPAAAAVPAAGATATITEAADRTALLERITALETSNQSGARNFAGMMLERSLLECALPDVFKTRLRKKFTERIGKGQLPTEDEVTLAIKEAVEDVGALREANLVMPHVGLPRVQIVTDGTAKVRERLANFFDPMKPLQSFKEIYVDITGDTKVNGKISEAVLRRLSEIRLTESLTTSSFDQILGDSITRRMLKDYADSGLANWRGTIAEVVPLSDFRTVRRMRFGGYGNLAIVTQGGPYPSMTSPTDEEATYSPAKRGGTEQITLEMIKNDDVGAVRRVPNKLARAAAQTLHEFAWDFLNNNALIYDGVALAAAGHGNNIVTTALSGANVSTLRLRIKQQADMSNAKRIGLAARYLIVPSELEELAFQLTTSDRVLGSNNNDPNFVKKLNLTTIVVEYWSDVNNYWVSASIDQAPMLEIGFLDGQETPELFVQDLPSQGSMFSNDQLTYKIRQIYGGAIMDFRPFAGAIVP